MATLDLKQSDYGAQILDQLLVNGSALNLTGATVYFVLRLGTATATRQAAEVVTPASGIVAYTLTAADTATTGSYRQEWEVVFADPAQRLTFPNSGYNTVRIVPDLQ